MAPFAAYPLFIPNKAGKRIRETARDTQFNETVRSYKQARGYGFIARDDSSKDVFVHAIALERSGIPAIAEGEKVSFEVDDDPRGRGKEAADLKLGLCGRRAALVGHLLGEASTPFGWTQPNKESEKHICDTILPALSGTTTSKSDRAGLRQTVVAAISLLIRRRSTRQDWAS